jgi:hypothetical protein
MFDYNAINNWIITNTRTDFDGVTHPALCPACRHPITLFDIHQNQFFTNLLELMLSEQDDDYSVSTGSTQSEPLANIHVSTQTDVQKQSTVFDLSDYIDDSMSDDTEETGLLSHLANIEEHNTNHPPFAYIGDVPDFNHFNWSTRAYIGNDTLVYLSEHLFNPHSTNVYVGPTVDSFNQNYISRRIPQQSIHPVLVVRKYLYGHRSDSLVEIARLLARQGYYIYDIFLYKNNGDLKTYCIYTCDRLADGTINMLSSLKKIKLNK